jgi:hypothetical protein
MEIKVGDIIKPKVGSYYYNQGDRFLARVTFVEEGEDTENHGTIRMELLECENYYLDVGEIESYVHYGWEDNLEVFEVA